VLTFLLVSLGTGLGITISNMIVNALEGRLVAFSAPEYGSCFTFAIPVKRSKEPLVVKKNVNSKEVTQQLAEELREEYKSHGFANANISSKPRILVVDDSTINRKICTRKIKKLLPDVEITECASGKTCLHEYEHDHKNIMGIFLDFHMPGRFETSSLSDLFLSVCHNINLRLFHSGVFCRHGRRCCGTAYSNVRKNT
jgi:hypothetical protein